MAEIPLSTALDRMVRANVGQSRANGPDDL